jgi:hypothetical protein
MKPFKKMVILYIIMPKSKRKAIVQFNPRNGFRYPTGTNKSSIAKSNDLINGLLLARSSGKRLEDIFHEHKSDKQNELINLAQLHK